MLANLNTEEWLELTAEEFHARASRERTQNLEVDGWPKSRARREAHLKNTVESTSTRLSPMPNKEQAKSSSVVLAAERFKNPEESRLQVAISADGAFSGRADIRGQHRAIVADWMISYAKRLKDDGGGN